MPLSLNVLCHIILAAVNHSIYSLGLNRPTNCSLDFPSLQSVHSDNTISASRRTSR